MTQSDKIIIDHWLDTARQGPRPDIREKRRVYNRVRYVPSGTPLTYMPTKGDPKMRNAAIAALVDEGYVTLSMGQPGGRRAILVHPTPTARAGVGCMIPRHDTEEAQDG